MSEPQNPGTGGSIQIDERKLLWGLVLVLLAVVAFEGFSLVRVNDRVRSLEDRIERSGGRPGGGERGAMMVSGGDRTRRAAEDGTPIRPRDQGSKTNGLSGNRLEKRQQKVKQRLDIFLDEKDIAEETATEVKQLVDDSMTKVLEIRAEQRAGTITQQEQQDQVQAELERRQLAVDELLGEELSAEMKTEVLSFQNPGSVTLPAPDGGQGEQQ